MRAPESHTHGEDAGTDATVVRYLIANDGAGCGVHDKPDVSFDTAYFYVRFVSCEHISFFVWILVNKGFDADGSGFAVVGDLLVGNTDVVKVFQFL
ncbi:MAG: hypothetical protein ACLR0U_17475 [Enterocloster clostridioformis]